MQVLHNPIICIYFLLIILEGLFDRNGESWKVHRLIAKKALTKFAPTPEAKEKIFKDEINHFLGAVNNTNGKPFCLNFLTVAATQNLMFRFVVGKRMKYQDDSFSRLVNNFIYLGRAVIHFDPPFLRPKKVSTRTAFFKKYVAGIIRERLQEAKQLPSGTECCYVGMLHYQQVAMDTLDFDEADIVADAFTPFVATSDATVLQWAMYFMIKYSFSFSFSLLFQCLTFDIYIYKEKINYILISIKNETTQVHTLKENTRRGGS